MKKPFPFPEFEPLGMTGQEDFRTNIKRVCRNATLRNYKKSLRYAQALILQFNNYQETT
ncbi:MAG: hypothetical protein LUM44_11945 [Pyrinomonadaceae bacterium]|nr:hypothetical protein [Pyrinomonadaceae bacterium]